MWSCGSLESEGAYRLKEGLREKTGYGFSNRELIGDLQGRGGRGSALGSHQLFKGWVAPERFQVHICVD